MNQVDKLKVRIAEIQGHCDHDWKLKEIPELRESLVSGVFIGKREPLGTAIRITLICTKCSVRMDTLITIRCPYCLSSMREIGFYTTEDDGTTSYKKYFGKDSLCFAIRLHRCTKCSFRVVSDEWNGIIF